MIKKVVIAAAGQGTRMLSLTKDKCKHLIEVNNRPFLAYLLDNLFKAGYRELVLVVGFKEEKMRDFVNNYNPPIQGDYKIELVSQFDILGPKEKEYGTACPIKCVKDIVGNNDFVYLCGDNFYSIRDLKSINIEDNYNYASGIEHTDPEKYGVFKINNGFVEKIVEKPKEPIGNMINVSLYKFTPEIFKKVYEIKKSERGEYEITDAVTLLAEEKKVKFNKLSDYWLDFGNPSDIEKFEKILCKDESHKDNC